LVITLIAERRLRTDAPWPTRAVTHEFAPTA
jgi:hypothetical protein